jgi:hypothetical protein
MHPSSKQNDKKYLVAEQPGLKLSLVAIILAILIGFIFRAVFSPDKIKDRLSEAIKNIGPDYQISFSRAHLSLANGIWPDLALLIEDVEVQFLKNCAYRPQAQIDQIRLPLNISALLDESGDYITQLYANSVLLNMNEPWRSCSDQQTTATTADDFRESISGAPTQRQIASVQKDVSFLKQISISQLKINYLPLPRTTFELQDLDFDVQSIEPHVFSLNAQLVLSQNLLDTDYASYAKVSVQFNSAEKIPLQSEVKGTWREGHYLVRTNLNPTNAIFESDIEIKHLPLGEVFPVLRKYQLMTSEFNKKQVWFSGRFQVQGDLDAPMNSRLQAQNLSIEGELGEIALANAKMESLQPFRSEPLIFDLKNIELNSLLHFLGKDHPHSAFGKLGTFDGSVEFKNEKDVKVVGLHQGLEFIFSNKGSRLMQKIDSCQIDFHFQNQIWKGKINKILPQKGKYEGEIQIQADRDWQNVDVTASAQRLELSPDVTQLITTQGEIDQLSFKVDLKLMRSELNSLRGQLSLRRLLVDKMEFSKPTIQFQTQTDLFFAQISSEQVKLETDSEAYLLLKPLSEKWPQEISSFKVQFKSHLKGDFNWSVGQGVARDQKIMTQGGWDADGKLTGQIKLQDRTQTEKWEIQGKRDNPTFIKN